MVFSSITLIEYSRNWQRLWSACGYAQADRRLCLSHIPHFWKSRRGSNVFCICIIQAGCSIFTQNLLSTFFQKFFQEHHENVKQFGYRSGPTLSQARSGFKLSWCVCIYFIVQIAYYSILLFAPVSRFFDQTCSDKVLDVSQELIMDK